MRTIDTPQISLLRLELVSLCAFNYFPPRRRESGWKQGPHDPTACFLSFLLQHVQLGFAQAARSKGSSQMLYGLPNALCCQGDELSLNQDLICSFVKILFFFSPGTLIFNFDPCVLLKQIKIRSNKYTLWKDLNSVWNAQSKLNNLNA